MEYLSANYKQQTSDNQRSATEVVRLSVGEAARLFGVHPRTIHRAIKEKKIRYIVVRNRYKLSFSSVLQWSQAQPSIRRKRDEQGIGQWVDQWRIRNTLYSPRPKTSK